jgi:hypothetical protein
VPCGVYDIAGDARLVSVGADHDTATLAVNAIRSWCNVELQPLADELGVSIRVCHLQPGTSK